MKRSLKILLAAVAVYLALLLGLVAVESGAPDSSIHSFGDAVWFSLITMTTVGYGDLSPVTAAGRVLGIVFALCSIGILTALIGIGLNLIGGQVIPTLRLRLGRKRRWYIFHEENEDSAALAQGLRANDPGCLLLFPAGGNRLLTGGDVIRFDGSPARLEQLRGGSDGCGVFCMGEDPWENFARAAEDAGSGFTVYCMADARSDDLGGRVHLFSRTEALARSYWKEHPLLPTERRLVLLGCGSAGSALLERAVLTNVLPGNGPVEYHVFNDTASFARLHPRLLRAMGADGEDADRLIFHSENWPDAAELLQNADRILLAFDEDADNLAAYEQLRTWFAPQGRIHLRLQNALPSMESFGARSQVITPEYVMQDSLNRQARVLHELYSEGADHPVPWEELNWFLRQSNISAADHLIVKIRYLLGSDTLTEVTPELCRQAWERLSGQREARADLLQSAEHRRWMRFHWLYNWVSAETRDNPRRRHPMLVPYEKLTDEEKRKDMYAWDMLEKLSRG